MISMLLLLFALLVPPVFVARWANVRFAQRRAWVIAMISAGIVPSLLLVPVIWVVVTALNMPQDQCGVDACSMNVLFGMMAVGLLVVLFLASFALNALIVYRARRNATPDHHGTFE